MRLKNIINIFMNFEWSKFRVSIIRSGRDPVSPQKSDLNPVFFFEGRIRIWVSLVGQIRIRVFKGQKRIRVFKGQKRIRIFLFGCWIRLIFTRLRRGCPAHLPPRPTRMAWWNRGAVCTGPEPVWCLSEHCLQATTYESQEWQGNKLQRRSNLELSETISKRIQ